ncbi:MAG: ferredoxin [Actinomycetota bacterium]
MSDDDDLVEVAVDTDVCVGSGQCEFAAPETFEVGDDGYALVVGDRYLPRALALDLAERCPSQAIKLVD